MARWIQQKPKLQSTSGGRGAEDKLAAPPGVPTGFRWQEIEKGGQPWDNKGCLTVPRPCAGSTLGQKTKSGTFVTAALSTLMRGRFAVRGDTQAISVAEGGDAGSPLPMIGLKRIVRDTVRPILCLAPTAVIGNTSCPFHGRTASAPERALWIPKPIGMLSQPRFGIGRTAETSPHSERSERKVRFAIGDRLRTATTPVVDRDRQHSHDQHRYCVHCHLLRYQAATKVLLEVHPA